MPLDFDLGIAFGQRNPLLWVSPPDFAPQPVTAAANTIYARSFHHEGRARGEFDETVAFESKADILIRSPGAKVCPTTKSSKYRPSILSPL
jgi:hypothetical protein